MNLNQLSAFRAPRRRAALLSAPALALCALLAGCSTAQLKKPTATVTTSLAPVVDQAQAAYRDAAAVHNQWAGYQAVIAYQNKDASYDPRKAQELLSEKDIQARLAVLAALQTYAKSLADIENGDSQAIDKASQAVGGSLTSLGNDLAPSMENVLGIEAAGATTTTTVTTVSGSTSTTTSSTTSSAAPLLSPEERNGISTAVDALGRYLINRTIENNLPEKITKMDPVVQEFCKDMARDVDALDSIEKNDYDRILFYEKLFILADEQSANLNPQTHRAEIMQLPAIALQQKEAHEKLTALRDAIHKFAQAHQALTKAAQDNKPESLKDKLSDLENAGSSLGNFYSSLPAK